MPPIPADIASSYEPDPRYSIYNEDCRVILSSMDSDSIDSVVTDPPYGLSFMGKGWDHGLPGVEFWRAILRVLKPGGHALVFGGTRTFHRLGCAIEDAGFEIRDTIMWVYGSGFPKSLDVSKAIDKCNGNALAWQAFSTAYAAAVSASALTHSDIDRALGIKSSSCYWARTDHRGGMPPRHHWERVRELLALPVEFARLYDEAEREVVGQRDRGFAPGTNAVYGDFSGDTHITAPATPAARQWSGWGTALKPAWEPVIVARKPLDGTVAENVLRHGTGGINVDGCRVGTEATVTVRNGNSGAHGRYGKDERVFIRENPPGRWPANVIHDGSDEVLALFPESDGVIGATREGGDKSIFSGGGHKQTEKQRIVGGTKDTGSAARFFYCAKASESDRGKANSHPTVKPLALIRYLCRLITQPGGLILDPFMGSGTTGQACGELGFRFVGMESDKEHGYFKTARSRTVSGYTSNTAGLGAESLL